MSRILLIEPDRMLRHALTIGLFPDHQVEAASAVPEAAAKDWDLLIVDAGALQERNLLSACERERLQKLQLPLLWFGPDGALLESDRDRWRRLQAPLTNEILRRALAQCLGASVAATKGIVEQAAQSPVETPPITPPKARKKKNTVPPELSDGKKFIELVEIVEDEPA